MAVLVPVYMRWRPPIQSHKLPHVKPEYLPKLPSQSRVIKEDGKLATVQESSNAIMQFSGWGWSLAAVRLVQIQVQPCVHTINLRQFRRSLRILHKHHRCHGTDPSIAKTIQGGIRLRN